MIIIIGGVRYKYKKKEKLKRKKSSQHCLRRGLNPGSSVYETDALPLGHRGWCMDEVQLLCDWPGHHVGQGLTQS